MHQGRIRCIKIQNKEGCTLLTIPEDSIAFPRR
ncbi:MAG: hypothetical protein AAFV85_17005 [Cyanobacteria bacterium J06634_6]